MTGNNNNYKKRTQTDFISSLLSKLRVDPILRYAKSWNLGNFNDDDIPNIRAVRTIVSGATNQKITLTKSDFTFDGTTLSHTFTTPELAQLGTSETEAGLFELDTVNGVSSRYPYEPNFTHASNDVTQPISGIYFVGLDQSVWDAGTFKVIVWAALSLTQAPSLNGQVLYKEVATYADMIASGVPSALTIYKLNDDSQYNYWPNGSLIEYGAGGGGTPTYSFETVLTGLLTKAQLNTKYPFAKTGDYVLQASENFKYLKLDSSSGGNWENQQYNGLLA